MNEEAAKWQERFSRPRFWAGAEPAPFLREVLPLIGRPGRALELAMGEGRNAVFLAEQGWRVTGLELAAAGLVKAEALAQERGVSTWRGRFNGDKLLAPTPGVVLVQADLSSGLLPDGPWDLLLVVNFLLRPLLPCIVRTIPPGAFLAYETYTVRQLEFEGARARGSSCWSRGNCAKRSANWRF